MAEKKLWLGKFNINNEIMEEKAEAYTRRQAQYLMAQKLAIKRGVIPQAMWEYLETHPQRCEIVPSV